MTLCPICAKAPAAADYKPFCSRRCADEDLSNWLSGSYAVPATPNEEDGALDVPTQGDPETYRH